MKLADADGAGDRVRRERLSGHGEDRGRLGARGREAQARPPAAAATYLVNGGAPKPGTIFVQKNLARTLRTLAQGRARRLLSRRDRAARSWTTARRTAASSRWRTSPRRSRSGSSRSRRPIAATRCYELPPNGQGLTALLLLNILEGIDLTALRTRPGRYYHTLIEATKIAFADRNRYIADPAFAKVPVKELLSKDYAARRRAADRSGEGDRPAGVRRHPDGQRHDLLHRRRQGPQRRVVHQQHLQRVRLGDRRRRHRHHAAQPRQPGSRSIPDIPIASSRASVRSTR